MLKLLHNTADLFFVLNDERVIASEVLLDLTTAESTAVEPGSDGTASWSAWDREERRLHSRRTSDVVPRSDIAWLLALVIRSATAVLLVAFTPIWVGFGTVVPLAIGLAIASCRDPGVARFALGVVRDLLAPPESR